MEGVLFLKVFIMVVIVLYGYAWPWTAVTLISYLSNVFLAYSGTLNSVKGRTHISAQLMRRARLVGEERGEVPRHTKLSSHRRFYTPS